MCNAVTNQNECNKQQIKGSYTQSSTLYTEIMMNQAKTSKIWESGNFIFLGAPRMVVCSLLSLLTAESCGLIFDNNVLLITAKNRDSIFKVSREFWQFQMSCYYYALVTG